MYFLHSFLALVAFCTAASQGSNLNRNVLEPYQAQPYAASDRDPNPEPSNYLTQDELQHLNEIYGPEYVQHHYRTLLKMKELGNSGAQVEEHRIPWHGMKENEVVEGIGGNREALYDIKLNAHNNKPQVPPNYNRNAPGPARRYNDNLDILSTKLQQYPSSDTMLTTTGGCNIHGIWLSRTAGVAIEILPTMISAGHIEIRTNILDLPKIPRGILSKNWTGSGFISNQSPTTLSIIFQEQNGEQTSPLPKSAVFAGQCLLCKGSSVLQGSWVIFENHQDCENEGVGNKGAGMEGRRMKMKRSMGSPETLYLLKKN